jgi:hypothetical protein
MRLSRAAEKHQELFARVLAAWARDGSVYASSRGALAPYLDNRTVPHNLVSILSGRPPVNLFDRDNWVVGRVVKTHEGDLFPIVSAACMVDDSCIMGTVRVALLQGDGSGGVRASGMRFESAEAPTSPSGNPNPHTYPHSQPARAWTIQGLCLIHPDVEEAEEGVDGCPVCFVESDEEKRLQTEHFNGHRPAVPLRCETLPGLAVAAIASVYGSQVAREILELDTRFAHGVCPQDVSRDFQHILGEDDEARFPG